MSSPDREEAATANAAGAASFTADGGDVTGDGFYGGRFTLLQPRGGGHRSGLDALLLAATVPPGATGRVGDLGAGAGAVGFAVGCRSLEVAVSLVEIEPAMADLARRSAALPQNHRIGPRLTVIEADLLASRAAREALGLADGSFDHVVTNPPFHPHGHRVSPDALRARALFAASPDFLARWIACSAALLRSGGSFAAILRADALPIALGGFAGRLGGVEVLPVHTRAQAAASRILVIGRKGSRAPLTILPGLVLRGPDGSLAEIARSIEAGTADLPDRA